MMRRAAACTVLLAVVYLAAGALSTPTLRFANDSYRYATASLTMLGESPEVAHERAIGAYCAATAARAVRSVERRPHQYREAKPESEYLQKCVQAHPTSLAPDDPRYQAIFEPRIGYPALAAPLVWGLGVVRGMWFASALCVAAAGVLLFMLLRSAGARLPHAAIGQTVLYVSPIGYWGSWSLAEGPATLCTVAALLGAWWMVNRRVPLGAAVAGLGLAGGVAVKYSSGALVATALCAAAVACLLLVPSARHRGTWTLAGLSGAFALGTTALSSTLGWPGINETLQEKFTNHFELPDVADPWDRLWELNGNFWQQWWEQELTQPVLLVCLAVGLWGLWRHSPQLMLLVTAVAATGVVTQVLHPSASQGDRLIATIWIAVAVGLPLAIQSITSPRADPRSAVELHSATLPRRAVRR